MIKRSSKAVWQGDLKAGKGKVALAAVHLKANIHSLPVLRKVPAPTLRN